MGERQIQQPPVRLFFAIMAREDGEFDTAESALASTFGPLDVRGDFFDFTVWTVYYEKEFGPDLRKRFVTLDRLVPPENLVEAKIRTNDLETDLAEGRSHRMVNIDPGYVNLSKVVLASTKDHWHRLYVREGIFEEVTLTWRRNTGFQPLEWTYPDYRAPERLAFFNDLRQSYRDQIRSEAS